MGQKTATLSAFSSYAPYPSLVSLQSYSSTETVHTFTVQNPNLLAITLRDIYQIATEWLKLKLIWNVSKCSHSVQSAWHLMVHLMSCLKKSGQSDSLITRLLRPLHLWSDHIRGLADSKLVWWSTLFSSTVKLNVICQQINFHQSNSILSWMDFIPDLTFIVFNVLMHSFSYKYF